MRRRLPSPLHAAIAIALAALVACATPAATPPAPDVPDWLARRIAAIQAAPAAHPPRSVYLTEIAGAPAYYVTPTCCDIPSELYDARGALVCHPDGGFAPGDPRCPHWARDRRRFDLLWKDTRQP